MPHFATEPVPASTPDCVGAPGSFSIFQKQARRAYQAVALDFLMPWAIIINTCGADHCMNTDHMIVKTPKGIDYPKNVCVYCGMWAGTRDHLIPRAGSGDARRILVATVPACADCNSRISDFPSPSVSARRKIAHKRLRHAKRKLLAAPDHNLDEYGPTLRSYIAGKKTEREIILERLAWPFDPFYDLRAFQESGIEDPVSLGLCDHPGAVGCGDEMGIGDGAHALIRSGSLEVTPRVIRRCSVNGCDKKHLAKGYCYQHYRLFERGDGSHVAGRSRGGGDQ